MREKRVVKNKGQMDQNNAPNPGWVVYNEFAYSRDGIECGPLNGWFDAIWVEGTICWMGVFASVNGWVVVDQDGRRLAWWISSWARGGVGTIDSKSLDPDMVKDRPLPGPVTPEPEKAPEVKAVTPKVEAKDVLVDTNITIEFSKKMNPQSVQDAFSLTDPEGKIITGTPTWESQSKMVFEPTENLKSGTTYVVRVTTAAKCTDDLNLKAQWKSKFSTLSPVVIVDPGHGKRSDGAWRGAPPSPTLNLQEDILVLDIARKLQSKLEALEYKVFMTKNKEDDFDPKKKDWECNDLRVGIAIDRFKEFSRPSDFVYVSIHCNTCTREAHGAKTIYCSTTAIPDEKGKKLGRKVLNQLKTSSTELDVIVGLVEYKGVNQNRNLIGKKSKRVVRDTKVKMNAKTLKIPATIVEAGYLSNDILCSITFEAPNKKIEKLCPPVKIEITAGELVEYTDEKALSNPNRHDFRGYIADRICKGIEDYFAGK